MPHEKQACGINRKCDRYSCKLLRSGTISRNYTKNKLEEEQSPRPYQQFFPLTNHKPMTTDSEKKDLALKNLSHYFN